MTEKWSPPKLPESFPTVEDFLLYASTDPRLGKTPPDSLIEFYKVRRQTFPEALFEIRNQHLQGTQMGYSKKDVEKILDSAMTSVINILQPNPKHECLVEKFIVTNNITLPCYVEEDDRIVFDKAEARIPFIAADYWKLVNN